MISLDFVTLVHDEILNAEAGLKGEPNLPVLEGCLARIDNHILYENLNDVLLIGSFYAMALAKAHAFPDGNKRTALVTMLTYLKLHDIDIKANTGLDELIVNVASSQIDYIELSKKIGKRVFHNGISV